MSGAANFDNMHSTPQPAGSQCFESLNGLTTNTLTMVCYGWRCILVCGLIISAYTGLIHNQEEKSAPHIAILAGFLCHMPLTLRAFTGHGSHMMEAAVASWSLQVVPTLVLAYHSSNLDKAPNAASFCVIMSSQT